jgi:ribosomal-protein-alanine N-acetyltransferase
MSVIETERLGLRELGEDDAAFILELLNEPAWQHFIGDRGVRTLDDARRYVTGGPHVMYARHGFGPWVVIRKGDMAALGLCGLTRRENLPDVALGYALFQRHWGRGYAREAAAPCLRHGVREFGLRRIVAITAPDNEASVRLLEAIGFGFERLIVFGAPARESRLFAYHVAPDAPP